MINSKIRISAVNFLNTLPFKYGLENYDALKKYADISYDIPSVCAQKLISDKVDIGLIPVAIIPNLRYHKIISDFCIGAEKKVDSVYLFGEYPKEKLNKIILDYRSKTSASLVKILAKKYWNLSFEYLPGNVNYETKIKGGTGGLVIGDKALQLINSFKFKYDLAEEWFRYTGNEFVFAAWVSNKEINKSFLNKFSDALSFGLNNIDAAIKWSGEDYTGLPAELYLKHRISYFWNESKKQSLHKYLELINYL